MITIKKRHNKRKNFSCIIYHSCRLFVIFPSLIFGLRFIFHCLMNYVELLHRPPVAASHIFFWTWVFHRGFTVSFISRRGFNLHTSFADANKVEIFPFTKNTSGIIHHLIYLPAHRFGWWWVSSSIFFLSWVKKCPFQIISNKFQPHDTPAVRVMRLRKCPPVPAGNEACFPGCNLYVVMDDMRPH